MKSFYYSVPIVFQKIGYVLFFILYKIFVRIEIKGRERIQGLSGPIILASNHTHELDATVISLALPFFSKFFPIYFVSNPTAKYKTFGWRSLVYGGLFFNMLGAYPIHSGKHDYAYSLADHIEFLKQGRTVFIFPEGKRTRDGNLGPARGGLSFLVHATKATVVPIAINTFYALSAKDFFTFRRKIVVTIGEPIIESELFSFATTQSIEDFQHATAKVLERIGDLL